MRLRVVGAALLLLAACDTSEALDDTNSETATPLEVTAAANGRTLHLQPGQELIVTLSECSGCGRVWTVVERPPMLDELAKADLGSDAPGMEAKVQYLFTAARTGAGGLVLRNSAPRGTNGPTLTFPIAVR